jgi:fluoroacetyl-CoA thioesterase
MDLSAGLSASVEMTVTDADTAAMIGSGQVPVLATPRVVALMEAATVAAVAGRLDAAQTTVGTRVEIDHHAPTVVGATVVAEARLSRVEGRKLAFEVVLREGTAVTAQGRIDRVVVDRERFLAKASAKTA